MIQAEGVVSYRPFQDAEELGSLVADDLAVLLTERFTGAGAARPAAAGVTSAATASPVAAEAACARRVGVSIPARPALRRPLIDRVES